MRLSISNIAWASEYDEHFYNTIKEKGYSGLEIAPTRIFVDNPYSRLDNAFEFSKKLLADYGLRICSLQSIWYGKCEKLFGSEKERKLLIGYTKKAILFAKAVGAENLVFGCPRNRNDDNFKDRKIAVNFFKELGDFAASQGTVLAMEANPLIYGTNFINTTQEAIDLIQEVNSRGFKLNLDVGTVIYNKEKIESLIPYIDLINHIHISEPNLKMLRPRPEHKELIRVLKNYDYKKFISIEMGKQEDLSNIYMIMDYVKSLCEVE